MKTKERVRQAIVDYIQEYDYPPSIREIANLAYCAQSVAHQYVTEMLRDGELESDHPGSPRTLRLPGRRNRIDGKELIEAIVGLSGCDGSDDYAKGWDDACKAILQAIEDLKGGIKLTVADTIRNVSDEDMARILTAISLKGQGYTDEAAFNVDPKALLEVLRTEVEDLEEM